MGNPRGGGGRTCFPAVGRSGETSRLRRRERLGRRAPPQGTRRGAPLDIIISNASGKPIYEQITSQIKAQIISGELKENDILPSVRTMAKELKISALTVKKAYDNLEAEGMTVTVHGKGTYVAASNTQLMEEERRKEVEADLEAAIQKGRRCGMKEEEIRSLFELIMEDE